MKIKTLADRTGQDEVMLMVQPACFYVKLAEYQRFMLALSQIEGVELDPYESRFELYHQLPAIKK